MEVVPDGVGEEELTRQGDLARFVRLAEEFGEGTVAEFLADLQSRFGEESAGRGVNLLTYHRAKGLEFDVVFLPRLDEGELPFKLARSGEALAEERRLLYVGMTRAKRHLELTWSGEPSRFLAELGVEEPERPAADDPVVKALKAWRLERAQAGRGARLRRLPRLDARGDRPPAPAGAVGAREGLRRRADEARALRRRGARDPRQPKLIGCRDHWGQVLHCNSSSPRPKAAHHVAAQDLTPSGERYGDEVLATLATRSAANTS